MEEKRPLFEIRIREFFRIVKQDKINLLKYIFAFAIAGIIVAFSIPKTYIAHVKLAPEVSGNNTLLNFSSLASMVGLYNDANPTGEAYYPEIYPELVNSNDFLVKLYYTKVTSKDKKINTTYAQYLNEYQKSAWWSFPLTLIHRLTQLFNAEDNANAANTAKADPFNLTKKQWKTIQVISNSLTFNVDKKTSIIDISVQAQDPLIAASLVDSVRNNLQQVITDYRTNKARNDLEFMENLYAEALKQYEASRLKYATYRDANSKIALASVQSKIEALESDMQLKYSIFTQVAQQRHLAMAKVQEKTPAFSILQPASVPVKPSNLPKVIILELFILLGIICRISVLIYKHQKTVLTINIE